MSDPQTNAPFLAPEIAELAPLFPGYEIQNLIATGGMGAVYRAIQKSLDRTVAIKILPKEFSKDAAFCAGFEAEAKAMARLNHPNLIGVFDFGEVNGMLFIIMEFVPGQSVYHSANGIAIDPGEVIRLVTGICHGLSHAHENGIIHRDIKPSNILLDLNTQPKIGDFGLARPIENKIKDGEEIFGTPHYTAPEVVNSPQSIGYRADIFSVGVMLHELLTGKLPADDQRPASAIVHCDPRFDAIIRKATNTVPELRYASASEMAKDLEIIAASAGPRAVRNVAATGAPVPHRPGGARRYSATSAKSKQSGSPVGGIVMLIIAGIVAFSAYKYYLKIQQPQKPVPHPIVVDQPATPQKTEHKDTVSTAIQNATHSANDSNTEQESYSLNTNQDSENDTSKQTSSVSPDKDTTSIETTEPKFDVPAFLTRARKIMQERSTSMITARDTNLLKNLEEFERELKRVIRKFDRGSYRDRLEEALQTYIDECKAQGNRIQPKPNQKEFGGNRSKIQDLSDFSDIHDTYLTKQDTIDAQATQSLTQLTPTYIKGIELQIERLKKDNDPGAIELLTEELGKTRNSDTYFPNLMLGIDSAE